MKKALITGITGQDGSYLSEFLLGRGYEVYGIIRRSSSFNTGRIDPIYEDPHVPHRRLHLIYGDLNDASSLNRILRTVQPDEIYNLGAQSHVRVSFDIPEYTGRLQDWARFGFWKPFESRDSSRNSIRPRPVRCSARCWRCPRKKRRRSIHGAPMEPQRSTPTGLPSTTGRPTISLRATVFCSITNHPGVVRPLSRGKSPRPPPGSSSASSKICFWAISTRSVIGAMPVTTSKPCG